MYTLIRKTQNGNTAILQLMKKLPIRSIMASRNPRKAIQRGAMPVRITTVDVEIMNTAAILIAYTFTIMYEAARAKRKVAELVSSCGAEMVATKTTAPITAAAANSIARNNKALPKKTV